MRLPSFFANKSKKTQEQESNYLTLTLTPDEILAAIWAFNEEQLEVIGFDKRAFTSIDSLVHQAAVTIDKAASLAQSDVSKVTFGLSHYWLENGELTKEISKILKTLSGDLELEAQAYISLASAINHLLKVEQSVTPHAVLVGKFEDFCEVHLIEGNKVVDTKIAKMKVNVEKVVVLINQLAKEDRDLPSRIILYGNSQVLVKELTHDTLKDLFMHEPKIDILQDSDLAKAVAYAQAQDLVGHDLMSATLPTAKTEVGKTNEFGFVEGEDILLTKDERPVEVEETAPHEEGEKKQLPIEKGHPLEKEEYAVELEGEFSRGGKSAKEDFIEVASTVGWLPKVFGIFKNRPSGKWLAIILGGLIAFILIASFVIGQFLTTADIIIKVQSKNLENDFKTQVVTGSADSPQLTGEEITSQASGTQKAVATGNKKIGQNAKGEVTIFNITSTPKAFSKGAVIITNSGLKFTLDEEVEATSASKPGQPSTIKASVTASEVGPQYNLDLGQQLSFAQFDEYSYWAQNDAPFSGGAEKEVTVVSKDDLDRLSKSLKDTLTEKAKSQLKEKVSGKKINDDAIVIKVLKSEFDKKVDEEASLVNLSMEVEASAIVYNEADLKENIAGSIKDEVPGDSESRAQDIEIIDLSAIRNKDSLLLSGKFRAKLVPKFNIEELKAKIAGKSEKAARSIIKERNEVADVEFKFTPNLLLTSSIPQDISKIKFEIEAI